MRIEGTITLDDDREPESSFAIETDLTWHQWGASKDRLGRSVDVIEAMAEGISDGWVEGSVEGWREE